MWGGSVLSSLVPRDLLTLSAQSGTGVAHAHPALAAALPPPREPYLLPLGFLVWYAQTQTDPSAWQDGPCLSGRFLW